MRRSGSLIILLIIGSLLATGCSRAASTGNQSAGAQAASCGSASFCMALIGIQSGPKSFGLVVSTSENGGDSWSRAAPVPLLAWDNDGSAQLTCATARECVAGDSTTFAVITLDRGKTWRDVDAPISGGTEGLTCLNQTCFEVNAGSVGVVVFRSRNGGKTWERTSQVAGPGALGGSIVCSSANTCLTLTGDTNKSMLEWTMDGGEQWRPVDLHLAPNQVMNGPLTCLPMGDCLVGISAETQEGDNPPVLVAGVDVISESGSLLANHPVFRSETLDGLSGLSCVSARLCFAAPSGPAGGASQTAFIYRSIDGGQTWSSVAVRENQDPGYESVVCGAGSQNCTMTNGSYFGSPLLSSTNGGETWTNSVVPGLPLRRPSFSHPSS